MWQAGIAGVDMHACCIRSIDRLILTGSNPWQSKQVGEACICRLARVLTLTPEVERLDLGANGLEALPDAVFGLRRLRELDVSGAVGVVVFVFFVGLVSVLAFVRPPVLQASV